MNDNIQILESIINLKEDKLETLYESILINQFNKLDRNIITGLIKNQDKIALKSNLLLIKTESQLRPEQKLSLGKRLGITKWIKSSIIMQRKAVNGREFKNTTFKTNRNYEIISVPVNYQGRLIFLKRNNKYGTYTAITIPYGSKENPKKVVLKSFSLSKKYLQG